MFCAAACMLDLELAWFAEISFSYRVGFYSACGCLMLVARDGFPLGTGFCSLVLKAC